MEDPVECLGFDLTQLQLLWPLKNLISGWKIFLSPFLFLSAFQRNRVNLQKKSLSFRILRQYLRVISYLRDEAGPG